MKAVSRTWTSARPPFTIDLHAFATCFCLQLEDCPCRCLAGSHSPAFPPTDGYLRYAQLLTELTLSEPHSFTKADNEAGCEQFLIRKNCAKSIQRSYRRREKKWLSKSIRF